MPNSPEWRVKVKAIMQDQNLSKDAKQRQLAILVAEFVKEYGRDSNEINSAFNDWNNMMASVMQELYTVN